MLLVAGTPVADHRVHVLVARLRDTGGLPDYQAADKLEDAVLGDRKIVALTDRDRDALLVALVDPPEGLEPLRGALLRQWQRRRVPHG